MKLVVYKARGRWWAKVEDEGEVIIPIRKPESRIGCAIRETMNHFQLKYGEPEFSYLEIKLDDW